MMNKVLRTSVTLAMLLVCPALVPAFGDDGPGSQVLVTRPGVVFHKAGAGDLRGHGVERSRQAALTAGYTPCPVCFGREISPAPIGSAALPGAGAAATVGSGATPASMASPVSHLETVPGDFSRFRSRVARTGCAPQQANCPYGLPFRLIPGL